MSSKRIRDMAYIALFAVLLAVCSWISIPAMIPFTMQTFGVFLTFALLGGRCGSLTVLVYLLLGAAGLPVFSGFTGGLGRLLHVTGGYLVGFQLSALTMWLLERLLGRRTWAMAASMLAGLVVCYVFGTAWLMLAYAGTTGAAGLGGALLLYVVPYIVPDLIKLALALFLSRRLAPLIPQKPSPWEKVARSAG